MNEKGSLKKENAENALNSLFSTLEDYLWQNTRKAAQKFKLPENISELMGRSTSIFAIPSYFVVKSPTTPIGRGLMKTPRRGLKVSQLLQITIQYNVAIKLKDYEHRTSNVQRRILNKVFCQFINWRSEAISSFDVRCSKKRFTLPFNILAGTVKPFRVARAEPDV